MRPVRHRGTVTAIGDGTVTVEIASRSMCASCHARGACTVLDMKSKNLDIETPDAPSYKVGEEVVVWIKTGSGLNAVLLSYVIPLIILLVLLLYLHSAGLNELLSAAFSVGGMAVYYLILYLFRGKLNNKIVFYIEKVN